MRLRRGQCREVWTEVAKEKSAIEGSTQPPETALRINLPARPSDYHCSQITWSSGHLGT